MRHHNAVLAATLALAPACVTSGLNDDTTEVAQHLDGTDPLACTADVMTDPLNCGACGTVCGSGLCYSGVCADDRAGHVTVIGASYRTSNPALDRVLGNAVFMTDKRPAKIVTWKGPRGAVAPADVVSGTNAALTRVSLVMKHAFKLYPAATSSAVQTMLPTADIFLVYAQPQSTDDYLHALGDEWSIPLDDFVRRGGVIVVLDAPSTVNSGTAQVLAPSSLMTLTRSTAPDSIGYVAAHGDAGTAMIPLMFALPDAVGYEPSTYTDLATGDTGSVIAAHRAVY